MVCKTMVSGSTPDSASTWRAALGPRVTIPLRSTLRNPWTTPGIFCYGSRMTQRSELYYNLHKQCLSVRRLGKPRPGVPNFTVSHMDSAHMADVTFAVQPAGRAKVRATGRKNVHAFVRGDLLTGIFQGLIVTGGYPNRLANEMMTNPNMVEVTYNPYKYDTFVVRSTGQPALHADKVYVVGRSIYAVGVR